MVSNVVGIVLTGGASRRMGADKSTLVVDGDPMARHVADALADAGCRPVECQGGSIEALAEVGLQAFADEHVGGGPVIGIATALRRHRDRAVVVAACDLIDLDAATINAVLEAAGRPEPVSDVVTLATGGSRHLVAWWRPGAIELVDLAAQAGVRSYRGLLGHLTVLDVGVSTEVVANINTPEDLAGRG